VPSDGTECELYKSGNEVIEMVLGVIKTKHIISHPIMIMKVFGFSRYLRMLALCFDHEPHTFLDILRME